MKFLILIIFLPLSKRTSTPDWIYYSNAPMLSSLTFADVNGDSIEELIATTYGTGPNPYSEGIIYVIDLDGTNLPGWPKTISSPIPSTPAIGDLDGDGLNEIFVGSWNQAHLLNDDGSYAPGWPLSYGAYYSPSLEDIDNDGDLEIVYPSSNSFLYIFEGDGTPLPGFPVSVPHDYPGTPAVGDIDGDGEIEIISGINRGPVTSGQFELYAWNMDGSIVDGFPVFLCGIIKSSPAVADLNEDGIYEIVVNAYHTSNYDSLYVISGSGEIWEGWPLGVPGCRLSSPAIGNVIRSEPGLEIVIGGGGTISPPMNAHLFILGNSGSLLYSFELPSSSGINSSPVLVDLDGDDSLEILIKIQDAICALNSDGTPVTGFPYALSDSAHSGTTSPTPAVGDPDKDGFLEMAFASCFGEIHYFDLNMPFNPDSTPWPVYKHDRRNTGNLPSPFEPAISEIENSYIPIFIPYPNPFWERIAFSRGFLQESVELIIYSSSGRVILKKNCVGNVTWDGRDNRGIKVKSGVYLALIKGENFEKYFKIVKQ